MKSSQDLLEWIQSLPSSQRRKLLERELTLRLDANPLQWIRVSGRIIPRRFFQKQVEFIRTWRQHKLAGLIGGNRSGKTTVAGSICVGEAIGHDPLTWQNLPPNPQKITMREDPVLIWAVTTTYDKSRMRQQREIWQTTPRALLHPRSIWRAHHGFYNNVCEFRNGSIIKFKSAEQDLREFESESVDLIWIDETIPLPYVRACLARLIDRRGRMIWTTIPDAPELHDVFVARRLDPQAAEILNPEDVCMVHITMFDNPYLPRSEIERVRRMWGRQEARMRIEGEFLIRQGLVYPDYNEQRHLEIVPTVIPRGWSRYEAIDPGQTNPTAVLLAGVDEYGVIHCYDEIYERMRTPTEIAAMIFLKRWQHAGLLDPAASAQLTELLRRPSGVEPADRAGERMKLLRDRLDFWLKVLGPCEPELTLIDPAATSQQVGRRDTVQDMYLDAGIPTTPWRNDKRAGIVAVSQYLMGMDGTPLLKVSRDCRWLRYEFQHYRWAQLPARQEGQFAGDRERTIDRDDHLLDCLYGLCLFRPSHVADPYRPHPSSPMGMAMEAEREALLAARRGTRPILPVMGL